MKAGYLVIGLLCRNAHGTSMAVAADGGVSMLASGPDLHLNTTDGQKVYVNGVDILGRLAAMETLLGALAANGAQPGSVISFSGISWRLVRRVKASSSGWHQATDNLAGTDSYGSVGTCGPTEDCSFSTPFSGVPFMYFLFATGDLSKWLITEKCQAACSEYGGSTRKVLRSSTSSTPYSASWLFRSGQAEDPWISLADHGPSTGDGGVLYGENGYAAYVDSFSNNNGANVFISIDPPNPHVSPPPPPPPLPPTIPPPLPPGHMSFEGFTWRLVRRVKASSSGWHQATDNLAGTDSYGSPGSSPTVDRSFSVSFSGVSFTYFLFATGDLSKWLITEKCQAACSYYGAAVRNILRSSTSSTPYSATWLFRSSQAEDPWISIEDHASLVVYGEASHTAYASEFQSNGGANVFISVD